MCLSSCGRPQETHLSREAPVGHRKRRVALYLSRSSPAVSFFSRRFMLSYATSRLLAGTPVAGMLLIHVSYVVRQPREQYTTDGDIHSTANVHADVSSSTQVRDVGSGPMPRRGNVLTMLTTHNQRSFLFYAGYGLGSLNLQRRCLAKLRCIHATSLTP